MSLSADTISTIKATVPALRAHGLSITLRMYERLFADAEIKALFNQEHMGPNGKQPKALAMALLAYAENIDNLGVLGGAVENMAKKHVAAHVQPEHYPVVAEAILGAIADVLGDAATPEILQAWGQAYWRLADILKGREAELYAAEPALA